MAALREIRLVFMNTLLLGISSSCCEGVGVDLCFRVQLGFVSKLLFNEGESKALSYEEIV